MLSFATDGFYCPPSGVVQVPGGLNIPFITQGEEVPAQAPLRAPTVVASGGAGRLSIVEGDVSPGPGPQPPKITEAVGDQSPSIVEGDSGGGAPLIPRIIDGSES